MEWLTLAAGWIICVFVGALAAAIVWKIFTGRIDLSKLISDPNGDASMSRLQLLIFTFVIAVGLFLCIVSQNPPAFPKEIPQSVLILLGISASSYLVSKGIQFSNPAGLEAQQITVSPPNPTVKYGESCAFKAQSVPPNCTVVWSVSAGAGSIDAKTGVYTAPAVPAQGAAGNQFATVKAQVLENGNLVDVAVVALAAK